MIGFFEMVLRIFRGNLRDMSELSEDQRRLVVGCLGASIIEAAEKILKEVSEGGS